MQDETVLAFDLLGLATPCLAGRSIGAFLCRPLCLPVLDRVGLRTVGIAKVRPKRRRHKCTVATRRLEWRKFTGINCVQHFARQALGSLRSTQHATDCSFQRIFHGWKFRGGSNFQECICQIAVKGAKAGSFLDHIAPMYQSVFIVLLFEEFTVSGVFFQKFFLIFSFRTAGVL